MLSWENMLWGLVSCTAGVKETWQVIVREGSVQGMISTPTVIRGKHIHGIGVLLASNSVSEE